MIVSFLLLLFSCGVLSQATCANSADCFADEVCRDGHCELVSCLRSADCAWSERCDMGVCLTGCELNSDCMAGLSCVSGNCLESSCKDTQIDCAFGDFCIDGVCVESELPICERCDYADWEMGMNDARECVTYRFLSESDCLWPEGDGCDAEMTCFPTIENDGQCVELFAFSYCETNLDCPQGFTCWNDIYGAGSGVSVCEANCNSYLDLALSGE